MRNITNKQVSILIFVYVILFLIISQLIIVIGWKISDDFYGYLNFKSHFKDYYSQGCWPSFKFYYPQGYEHYWIEDSQSNGSNLTSIVIEKKFPIKKSIILKLNIWQWMLSLGLPFFIIKLIISKQQRLQYEISDNKLNSTLKSENIEVNLKPKLTEKEAQNISKIKAEKTNSFWFFLGAILISVVVLYYIFVGLFSLTAN